MIDCLFLALIPVSAPWLMYAAKRPYTSQVYSILAHDIHLDRPHLNTSCRFLHPSPAMLLRVRLSPYSSRSWPFAHLCLPTNGWRSAGGRYSFSFVNFLQKVSLFNPKSGHPNSVERLVFIFVGSPSEGF